MQSVDVAATFRSPLAGVKVNHGGDLKVAATWRFRHAN